MSPRGFEPAEFAGRLARAQAAMAKADLGALLLTTEPEVRYFTGFLTRFWESPTRPWFLVVPAAGDPVAVIPAIGVPLMARTGLRDIRSWSAPDYADDGISLLAATLRELVPGAGRIGMPDGLETHVRMPLADLRRLQAKLAPELDLVGDAGICRDLRAVKSEAEIGKIAKACAIAGRAFARVPQIARAGVPLAQVFRDFQALCLNEGADWVPYLAGAAAAGGYADVISPATEAKLEPGDVLMLDTGLTWDGYFCDYDRNFSIGAPSPRVAEAHKRLIEATEAGRSAAQVGARACDVRAAMAQVLGPATGGGRFGHGLGMQLTEGLSLIPEDKTELRAGMVLTLEPGIEVTGGRILVHEENIVIRANGADWLSPPASPDIPVLEALP